MVTVKKSSTRVTTRKFDMKILDKKFIEKAALRHRKQYILVSRGFIVEGREASFFIIMYARSEEHAHWKIDLYQPWT